MEHYLIPRKPALGFAGLLLALVFVNMTGIVSADRIVGVIPVFCPFEAVTGIPLPRLRHDPRNPQSHRRQLRGRRFVQSFLFLPSLHRHGQHPPAPVAGEGTSRCYESPPLLLYRCSHPCYRLLDLRSASARSALKSKSAYRHPGLCSAQRGEQSLPWRYFGEIFLADLCQASEDVLFDVAVVFLEVCHDSFDEAAF